VRTENAVQSYIYLALDALFADEGHGSDALVFKVGESDFNELARTYIAYVQIAYALKSFAQM
jgi:hypothetical protein